MEGEKIMHHDGITPLTYFYQNTKLFLRFIGAHYKKDEKKLEDIYMETLELYERYMDTYMDKKLKKNKMKEITYELLEILSMREQNDELRMKDLRLFRGLKIKEKILASQYIELWANGNKLWLYIYENNRNKELFIPYIIESPYLFDVEQTYYALKDKICEVQKNEH